MKVAILGILMSTGVMSAEITKVEEIPCQVSIKGEILTGDSSKLLALLKEGCEEGRKIEELSVDSLGGSDFESIKMVSYIQAYKLKTKVVRGSSAISAGFSLLMAGRDIKVYEGAVVGTHAVWYPRQSYNDIYLLDEEEDQKPPFYHLNIGITSVTNAIKFDRETLGIPGWLIVKYITKINGSMYYLNFSDVIKLEAEGKISYIQQGGLK